MKGIDKGKGMYLFFIKSEAKTPGGLLARPVLTSYYKSRYFKERPYDPYNIYREDCLLKTNAQPRSGSGSDSDSTDAAEKNFFFSCFVLDRSSKENGGGGGGGGRGIAMLRWRFHESVYFN